MDVAILMIAQSLREFHEFASVNVNTANFFWGKLQVLCAVVCYLKVFK